MIKIKIIALGKLKEKFFISAADEYAKRLSRFCDLEIVELSPYSLPESPSNTQIESALENEATQIEKHITKNSYIFSLCVEGKEISSEEFSEKIKELSSIGKSITFIIGSSYGLSKRIKDLSDMKLSVSKMTFPHKLFRVMLLEQIYRGFMINEGSAYHK